MTATTTTPLMGMILPVPSVEVGPAWATEIVTAMNVIDSHTHTTGSGSSLTLGALNVNQNLNMLQYGITNASYFKSLNNVAPIAGSTATCLYASGGELYYNDNSGNQIKLTSSGGINLTSIGAIGGDYSTSTASVSYSTATTTFTFTSNTGIYSKVNVGNLKIYEAVAGGNAVELKTSTGLASSYSLTLPTALPASSLPLIVSTAGVISTAQITTAQIADSQVSAVKLASDSVTTIKILDSNVTANKLASDSVTTVKILNANVTDVKLASNSVITAKILDSNVTANKLASDSVTTIKILDANVTDTKLASNSVTTAKILNGNVTKVKNAVMTYTRAGNISYTTSVSATSGALATAAITTVIGNPVCVNINIPLVAADSSSLGRGYMEIKIYRDGTEIMAYTPVTSYGYIAGDFVMDRDCFSVTYIDPASLGAHTYTFKAVFTLVSGACSGTVSNGGWLTVYEL